MDDKNDPHALLRGIADPEERARTAREWGLLDFDANGRRAFQPRPGVGSQTALARAVVGHDREAYISGLLRDDSSVEDWLRRDKGKTAERNRRRSYISREDGGLLFDAASALPQLYGIWFNAFITIVYQELRVADAASMTKLLTAFLDEAGGQMQRWGSPWHWIYVHERSAEFGPHTHILATIAPQVRAPFVTWARDGGHSFFWRHCRRATETAVDIIVKAPTNDKVSAQWQMDRLHYITKGLDPEATGRDEADSSRKPLLDLMDYKYRRPYGAGVVPFRQRCGGSRSIWGVREETGLEVDGYPIGTMPVLSPFRDGAWSRLRFSSLDIGWEAAEHEARRDEKALRRELVVLTPWTYDEDKGIAAAREAYPSAGRDQWARIAARAEVARRLSLRADPRTWGRSWPVWWKRATSSVVMPETFHPEDWQVRGRRA